MSFMSKFYTILELESESLDSLSTTKCWWLGLSYCGGFDFNSVKSDPVELWAGHLISKTSPAVKLNVET